VVAGAAAPVALANPVAAQATRAGTYAAPTAEIGFFTYHEDRYPDDFELRVTGGLGFRYQTRGLFVEPQIRATLPSQGDRGRGLSCSDGLCNGSIGAVDPIASFAPGVNFGAVLGDEAFSHSFVMRAAVGVGASLQPLVAVRHEASARWMAFFTELSLERLRWSSIEGGETGIPSVAIGTRWEPGLHVGARIWMRSVTAAAPPRLPDAGIIGPEPRPAKPKSPPGGPGP
jgi:hypothetical protein